MSIFADLLFLHGHIADPALANQLAQPPAVVPGHHPEVPDATPEADPGPLQDAGYRPRSWRYPMALFHALGELPTHATGFEAAGVARRPRYGNRIAWTERFPGFGASQHGRCSPCHA
jgi:hypothetical protein